MGYVGLPTALSLAERGDFVIGIDVSSARITDIAAGRVDLLARDSARLAELVGRPGFRLTGDYSEISTSDAVIICVPTPTDDQQTPNLSALESSCSAVVEHARPGQTIILTSTTYVGCTRALLGVPLEARGLVLGRDISVAFSPERINPGVVDHAPESTPRIVGGTTPACTAKATAILAATAARMFPVSSPDVAEMAKLLENTFRAVNIALANEFADAAEDLGVDVIEVIEAAATKPYGFMPFYPGPGAGGHCIPCDPHYLLWQLRGRRMSLPVLQAAMTAIATRSRTVVTRARNILAESGIASRGARILVYGVSYKPDVSDVRESPALSIIDDLAGLGAVVADTDPFVPRITTPNTGALSSETAPAETEWDLIIVHTLHSTVDHDWLLAQRPVFDASYRMTGIIDRTLDGTSVA